MFYKNKLSDRQYEIIKLIAQNYSNKEIANKLYVSESTVKSDIRLIMELLNAYGRVHLALIAYKRKIIKI